MSAPGPAHRPGGQSRAVVAGLGLVVLALCGLACRDLFLLARLGWPGQPAGAAGPPAAPATPTIPAALGPGTLTPLPSPQPGGSLPTATSAPFPEVVLPPGRYCAPDGIAIEAVEPASGAAIPIGSGSLSVTVTFCLQSVPTARLILALVSSAEQPQTVPFGGSALVQRGEGRFSQTLDWAAAPWSAELAGSYRLVAALTAEEDGRVLASAFGGQYDLDS
jgi:hypothetical protein